VEEGRDRMRWLTLILIAFIAQFFIGCAETEVEETGQYTFIDCVCDCEEYVLMQKGYITKVDKENCFYTCGGE